METMSYNIDLINNVNVYVIIICKQLYESKGDNAKLKYYNVFKCLLEPDKYVSSVWENIE
jgi:hypothetical protein